MNGSGPSRSCAAAVRAPGSSDGVLRVPQGHAGGLRLDMSYLPISHAHLASIAFGNLESAVQEAMVRHLGRGGVLYDIGANLGFFSLAGSASRRPREGHVYAFEAAPENAAAIARNAELNGLPNVDVIAKAVSAHSGRGRLQVVDDQSWSKLEEYGDAPVHRAGDRGRAGDDRRPVGSRRAASADGRQDRRRGRRARGARRDAPRRSPSTDRRSSASCTTPTRSSSRRWPRTATG